MDAKPVNMVRNCSVVRHISSYWEKIVQQPSLTVEEHKSKNNQGGTFYQVIVE